LTPKSEGSEVVRLNDVNLAKDEPTDVTIDVASRIKHPDYGSFNYDDIALFKLAKDVTFSSSVYPICLSAELPIEPESFVVAIGFGLTEGKF
jgi:Trypsin